MQDSAPGSFFSYQRSELLPLGHVKIHTPVVDPRLSLDGCAPSFLQLHKLILIPLQRSIPELELTFARSG